MFDKVGVVRSLVFKLNSEVRSTEDLNHLRSVVFCEFKVAILEPSLNYD